MTDLFAPLQSLKQGDWFKLICGASFQHLPAVRSLTLAYTLAGADCIDVAADPAVIAAAQAGLLVAKSLATDAQKRGFSYKGNSPFLMVSLNDGEDPHFRKAEFNPTECPTDCPRPCERICPAQAIVFNNVKNVKENFSGVISEKCYGCGRCIPVCPYSIIDTSSYMSTPGAIAPLVMSTGIDAVEIHTKVGRLTEFEQLWQAISPWADQLKLVAISCPDGEGMIDYLRAIYDLIAPLKSALIWQTDGRAMSGDIGDGTTIAAVKLGQKVLAAKLPGYVQLAGGTNSYTVAKLKAMGMLKRAGGAGGDEGAGGDREVNSSSSLSSPSSPSSSPSIAGVAYGSYARVLLSPILEQLENKEVSNTNVQANLRLEENDVLLWQAVKLAHSLVSQIKSQQEH
ncbi:4Fe-4S ferredoxin iron-sulfur binding domain-containing protein [Nostoc commune NIES-4072]|uniref:4Fe-4S ferredoxin iron-sulfur binding domain-containing protein n=1 Tax=Nostoc commune NIES-4072 TaxID=2005467 RepID=A0A2R5FYD7_NOSCO|nr:LdpA C-terminal domain-containing domain [Nostoc commune]BBD68145.1 4Fe-4S ferredoxin iron-sulfur binding domain-containing protein [Nostoc commune HK-02]GBG20861.1 4Fe-4S ferredoxin iron-sulfur binding domain-containing protein [Nostoc commune NIES-4072]